MKKLFVATITVVAMISLAGCDHVGKGKGKGKGKSPVVANG